MTNSCTYFYLVWMQIFASLFLWGCGSFQHQNLKRRNTVEYHVSSQVVQYFLPNPPLWTNFSPQAKCHRQTSIRYFDLGKMRQDLNFTYEESLQFQYLFNKKLNENKHHRSVSSEGEVADSLEKEERLFYDVTEAIRAGRKPFTPPEYHRIHLVWIDEAIKNVDGPKKVQQLMERPVMGEAPVIFISDCLSHFELEKFLKETELEKYSYHFLPFEIFSVYNENNEILPFFHLNLSALFKQGTELHLFAPANLPPTGFLGVKKIHTF